MRYHMQTETLLRRCAGKARNMGHSYVGSVHLLLAMAEDDGITGKMLRGAGLDLELTEKMLVVLYGVGTPDLPLPQGMSAQLRQLLEAAVEAGAHIAGLIGTILKKQVSGVGLHLEDRA